MRLVTWNCRIGGFRWKAKHIAPMRPDILAVQEVETIGPRMFPEDARPTYCDRSCASDFPRRGFGMFSYSQTSINGVVGAEPFSGFRRYEVHRADLSFNVVGVWPWATRSVKTSYRQAHDGLLHHEDWVRQRDTVLLGDFNASAKFNGNAWRELVEHLEGLELVSAYHAFKNQSFGQEVDSTHFPLMKLR